MLFRAHIRASLSGDAVQVKDNNNNYLFNVKLKDLDKVHFQDGNLIMAINDCLDAHHLGKYKVDVKDF